MIDFEKLLEYEIEQNVKLHIQNLLVQSFPEYPQERIYYKLLPQFRYLAWMGEELIAHMGVEEHQTIGVAERSLADCMMVKPTAGQTWENGPVDMLG
jgi:hypothetical protein